jgi:hypothetical protein
MGPLQQCFNPNCAGQPFGAGIEWFSSAFGTNRQGITDMNAQQTKLEKKAASPENLARAVIKKPSLVPEVFDGLTADKARVKYGCLKSLRLISEKRPDILYRAFDRLLQLLDSKNNILKWGATIIIGNLATVDLEGKIEGILDRYLEPIAGPAMITAANVIGGAGKIARAKADLADRIARALLRVESANYQTAECRNVAIGHAIASFDLFFEHLEEQAPVMEFVERQLENRRNAVRTKASKFLKRHAVAAG